MMHVTATDLPRLLACNGSRLMAGGPQTPAINADDKPRKEGDAADWLIYQVHAGFFKLEELIDRRAPNGIYITAEMAEHVEPFLALAQGGTVQHDTSFFIGVAQIAGRADLVKYDPHLQKIIIGEFKYGWRIADVHNWTLLAHAIGFAKQINRPVQTLELVLHQPRPYHPGGPVRTWSVTLPNWNIAHLEHELYEKLVNLSDALQTGSHCYKCPALAFCPAARNAQMNAIEASEQAYIDNPPNQALGYQLDNIRRAIEILKQSEQAYSEMIMHRLRSGQIIENYALQNDLGNRSWKQHITPETVLALTGQDLTKKELITPAQAIKKGVNETTIESLTERKNKGIKLVRMDANTRAQKIFNTETKGK